MTSTTFTLVRFGFALLTIIALFGYRAIPPKTLQIFPRTDADVAIYGPLGSASWLARATNTWRCDYRTGQDDASCGLTVSWQGDPTDHLPQLQPPTCVNPNADHDGDGWGWEHDRSCLVPASLRRLQGDGKTRFPRCQHPESDHDGDGWGWENQRTCQVRPADNAGPGGTWRYCQQADPDPEGDGWGTEQNAPCVVTGGIADPTITGQASPGKNATYCEQATIDTDHDGWGRQQNRSCLMPPQIIATSEALDSHTAHQLRGIDMSDFQSLRVTLNYEGKAEFLRIYVRNFDPDLNDLSVSDSTKYMTTYLLTADLKAGPAVVSFDQFRVAEWWLRTTDQPLLNAQRDFDNVVRIGFDYLEHGVHRMQVEKIELIGDRIPWSALVYGLCGLWFSLGLSLVAARALSHDRSPADGDAESEIWHSVGGSLISMAALIQRFQQRPATENTGLLVVRTDSADAVEPTLTALGNSGRQAQPFTHSLWHLVAQQADGELVIMVRQTTLEHLQNIAGHIKHALNQARTGTPTEPRAEASVGFTLAIAGEAFEETLNRAEWALYQTMQSHPPHPDSAPEDSPHDA